MDFWEVIGKRRSVRKFTRFKISKEHILKILDAGRCAPSGGNRQPSHFIVVDDHEIIRAISRLKPKSHWWIEEASLIIAGTTNPEEAAVYENNAVKKNLCEIDLAISMSFMDLAAVSLGFGTCWVACHEDRKAKELLQIPAALKLVAMLVVGKGEPGPKAEKKGIEKISSYLKYKNPLKITGSDF